MPNLCKEKLNELKRSKNFTSKDIAEKTGIPKSTIDKIFGGFNQNPTVENLQKIANVLDCGIDDFLENSENPTSPFSIDRIVNKISYQIYENQKLHELMDNARLLHSEDIDLLISLSKRLKSNNF